MCEYCEKVINKPLIESDSENSGIEVNIAYWKKKKKAQISAYGWFDSCVGIESVELEINYCPMCGRGLNNKVLEGK